MPPTVTVPAGYDTDASILKAELKIYLGTGLIISNITQPDMGTTSGLITASAGAPATTQDGRGWWHTGATANGPDKLLTIYDAAQSRDITPPINSMDWASLPATGTPSERVYVTDLQITVEYRDGTTDAILSGSGLAGWHPVAAGLMLVENVTGATIEKGRVVAFVGTSATRRVAKTTIAGQPNVLGVALLDIADTKFGIVATPAYGKPVQVYGAFAFLPLVSGDILGASSVAGEARDMGPDPATPFLNPVQQQTGMYLGGFARALQDSAANGLVMARMLGAVGQGCRVTTVRAISLSYQDLTPSFTGGVYVNFFPTHASVNNNGGQGVNPDLLVNAYHIVRAVSLEVNVNYDDAANNISTIIGINKAGASASLYRSILHRYGTNAVPLTDCTIFRDVPVNTSIAVEYEQTATAPGTKTAFDWYLLDYIC